jgi:D-lactate dehydrogenase
VNDRNSEFIKSLKRITGQAQVVTGAQATQYYRTGFRSGGGKALAVVRPRSLIEQWRVLEACVAADKIIIMQAANTSLTGGSTPSTEDYDRDVVIINTMYMAKLHILDGGKQVVCLPGSTLYQLEEALLPYGREPHSVIGSSCIGASVIGGICNNSGGSLIRRGPAYTEMALFAQLDENRQIHLVNHLGVKLGKTPEEILSRLESGEFTADDVEHDPQRSCSDQNYIERIRNVDAEMPSRFNADPKRLFEASGSAGKLMVFAVRLDTFQKEDNTSLFYIGTNDPAELTTIRRHILMNFRNLPLSGEYMHRDAFDIASIYGKDTFLAIQYLGTRRLPWLFRFKACLDGWATRLGLQSLGINDRILQYLSYLFPNHLPKRMRKYRDRFAHHLLLKMSGDGIREAASYLGTIFPSTKGDFFQCNIAESNKAFLHRFVAAGAAIRYRAIHADQTEDILSLDIALRQNDREWFESLPDDISAQILHSLYYGHFFCHVFHQDYIIRKGCDIEALKKALCQLLDMRGAEYPAEHNVGHLYKAKPALVEFYRQLDPCNHFNPGIGQTSSHAYWHD